jgi:hypothetical protein
MVAALRRIYIFVVGWFTRPEPVRVELVSDTPPQAPAIPAGPSVRSLRGEIADVANDLLDRLNTLNLEGYDRLQYEDYKSINNVLSQLLGCDFHLLDGIATKLDPEGRLYAPPEEEELVDCVWPIDSANAIRVDGEGRIKTPGFHLDRIVTRTKQEMRGRIRFVPDRIVTYLSLWLPDDPNVRWQTDTSTWGWVGKRWVPLDCDRVTTESRRGTI